MELLFLLYEMVHHVGGMDHHLDLEVVAIGEVIDLLEEVKNVHLEVGHIDHLSQPFHA